MKEYKVKINKDECKKLNFLHIYDITLKEEILELDTFFFRHFRDYEMLYFKAI